MRREIWKNQDKTEILDDDFLTNLEKEVQKRYPHNTSDVANLDNSKNKNIEFLEDTIELLIDDDVENKYVRKTVENNAVSSKEDDILESFYNVIRSLEEDTEAFIAENKPSYVDVPAKNLDVGVEPLISDNVARSVKSLDDVITLDTTVGHAKSLDDTIELLNDKFEELNKVSKNLDQTIEFLKSDVSFLRSYADEDIEILDEEIDDFEDPSQKIENTTELLDITRRLEPIQVKKKVTPKKRPWIILLTLCICVIVLLSYRTVFWYIDSRKTNQQIENIVKTTYLKETTINNENSAIEPEFTNFLDVNFSDLIKKNSDVKGWIKVNNTNINYPFVQTTDNDFYLKHSFDKSWNSAGWVFADFRNDFEELQQNTILYAHGRLDNTMFGSLKQVVEKEWYENEENEILQISALESNSLWQVFSVYTIKPETYYITPYFINDDDYQKFLDTLANRSVYDFDVTLSVEDKILTLSSCYNDELRVVLHAKLVNTIKK